jgi:hypothetical protein
MIVEMTGHDLNSGAAKAITFVVTSCGRFDLLEETLASFLTYNSAPIARYVLIEDSGDVGVRDVVAKFDIPIEVIVNDPPLGQIASIDHVYATIDTPYIFHCEDDWRFFRPGFVEDSLVLLTSDPSITVVVCRRPRQTGPGQGHDRIYSCPVRTCRGVQYRKATPWMVPHWLGYSFNPGLRRLSDYRMIGSFGRWGHEIDASLYFKRHGMTISTLEEPACEHTGAERRVLKQLPNRSLRSRLQKLESLGRYALRQRLDRLGQATRRVLKH